jgi:hypothetical protein
LIWPLLLYILVYRSSVIIELVYLSLGKRFRVGLNDSMCSRSSRLRVSEGWRVGTALTKSCYYTTLRVVRRYPFYRNLSLSTVRRCGSRWTWVHGVGGRWNIEVDKSRGARARVSSSTRYVTYAHGMTYTCFALLVEFAYVRTYFI